MNKNVKSKEYSRQYRERLQEKKLYLFGDSCELCDSKLKLHLHHKHYEKESIRPRTSGLLRLIEAVKNPNRFQIICRKCHDSMRAKHHNVKYSMKPAAIYQRNYRSRRGKCK